MSKHFRRDISRALPAPCLRTIFAFFLTPLLQAAPAWQQELTTPKPGQFLKPAPSVIDFQLSWKGTINSGKIRIEFAPPEVQKPGIYVVRSSSTSLGAAALLYPYQNHFWSELDSVSLRPRFFCAVETDKKESVTTSVRHTPGKVKSQEITKITQTGKIKTTDRLFTFAPVFDVFSAMLHIRSQTLDTGDTITLVIHPFDTPYLLRVKVLGREVHSNRNAIHLTLGMRKIDRKTLELLPYTKLKQDVTLWLSDDNDRIPLELRATAFIGDVRATLVSHRKL